MPPTRRAPEALCFRVVRPSFRPYGNLVNTISKNPLVDFYHTWPRDAPWGVDELIRFWARSAQGQRSKVNKLGLNMLFLPRKHDISKTLGWIFIKLGTGVVPWGVDELIRFWAKSAQRQRSKVNELGLNMLFLPRKHDISKPLGGFSSNLAQGCTMRSRWTD